MESKRNFYDYFEKCFELFDVQVNPVGPLCKSGGVRELARINSPELTAFSSIAWIPAILPR